MMDKYVIHYNIGYGDNYSIVEVESEDDARNCACDAAIEEVKSRGYYGCIGLATPELLLELGIEE